MEQLKLQTATHSKVQTPVQLCIHGSRDLHSGIDGQALIEVLMTDDLRRQRWPRESMDTMSARKNKHGHSGHITHHTTYEVMIYKRVNTWCRNYRAKLHLGTKATGLQFLKWIPTDSKVISSTFACEPLFIVGWRYTPHSSSRMQTGHMHICPRVRSELAAV